MAQDFRELLDKLNIKYKDVSLYEAAFTHASYRNENQSTCTSDYDRLEFIGDAVLDLVVGDFIFQKFPNMNSGQMSKCRASLVRGATEASFAEKLGFDKYIKLSKGENKDGKVNPKFMEDVFEAFIGAFYMDNHEDFALTEKFVYSFFAEPLNHYEELESFDYKSKLQEIVQADVKVGITYNLISEIGEQKDKIFEVEATVNGVVLGTGKGTSKKKAEQAAAKDAIERRVN